MEHRVALSEDDVARLKQFHAAHFPDQNVPSLEPSLAANNTSSANEDKHNDDNLGYYEDSVKRTLTDDQIAMFRNSEIQRIIQQRKRAAAREEEHRESQKRKQDDDTMRQEGQKTWTRHFDEAPQSVDTLMYDETPVETGPRKFLWPKLG